MPLKRPADSSPMAHGDVKRQAVGGSGVVPQSAASPVVPAAIDLAADDLIDVDGEGDFGDVDGSDGDGGEGGVADGDDVMQEGDMTFAQLKAALRAKPPPPTSQLHTMSKFDKALKQSLEAQTPDNSQLLHVGKIVRYYLTVLARDFPGMSLEVVLVPGHTETAPSERPRLERITEIVVKRLRDSMQLPITYNRDGLRRTRDTEQRHGGGRICAADGVPAQRDSMSYQPPSASVSSSASSASSSSS